MLRLGKSLETAMGINKDQVKGRAKEAAGKVQQAVGKVTGNLATEVKGLGKQAIGVAQAKYGDAKQTIEQHKQDPNKGP
jgi:uncharacterized protein YjbJ (UPF0337 family)